MEDFQNPRDGDIILTKDYFIFNVFGYDHPSDKIIAYLKYIPKEIQAQFQLSWIPSEWNLGDIKYVRPQQLYSPEIFKELQNVFKKNNPEYLYRDPYIGKKVFVVPHHLIRNLYVPKVLLQELLKKEYPDPLEKEAIELIQIISQYSDISLSDFGLYGSLLTGMHRGMNSDIDIIIYGAQNYLKVKKIVFDLFKEKKIEYFYESKSDEYRMNKCLYKGHKFVFNSVRKNGEIRNEYGKFKFSPIRSLHFYCDVVRSMERMFRPAIYNIEDFFPVNDESILIKTHWPSQVVSMVGKFRDIAKKGDEVEVQGLLERVEEIITHKIYYRIVIGSGQGEEFIWPV
ncbi:MAG: hypothetical protein ACFFD2_15065 [Promethearchaeota archaeon]